MNRRRTAFTLIEMLVVIGVILILMTMAVIGYQVVEKSAAGNQTKVTLNNLNAMLAELDAAAGSNSLPAYQYTAANPTPPPANMTYPLLIGALNYAPPFTNQPAPAGITWSIGDVTSGGSDRYPNPNPNTTAGGPLNMVAFTQQIAMAALIRIPNNLNAIKQLPSNRLMKDPNGNPYQIPILLDGWGNPIIYVPAGGIWVYVTTGNGVATLINVKSADNRPFFASAGPDGNFGAVFTSQNPPAGTQVFGDDNVYSKE